MTYNLAKTAAATKKYHSGTLHEEAVTFERVDQSFHFKLFSTLLQFIYWKIKQQ